MRRRPPADDEEEEDGASDADDDLAVDEEPSGPPRRHRTTGRAHRPLKAWSPKGGSASAVADPASQDDADDEEDEDGWRGFLHRPRRPIFYRARDTVWFEPLVALAIVLLLLVSLYAYTSNWPPVYVVESGSMQHGSADQVGLINTGDLVLAQKLDPTEIVPYVVGASEGYRTYGEFGDVLLYHANGIDGPAPIIHRALFYAVANPNGTFSVPQLLGTPCGSMANALYNVSDHPSGCGPLNLRGTITLSHIGWRAATVSISWASVGSASGFVTLGDNNLLPGVPAQGVPDEPSITTLVQPAWIIGVARGMIPWFGAIKLVLGGDASMVPPQSWQFLGLTVIGLFAAAMGIHYALRAEGIEDDLRREEERDEVRAAAEEGARRGWRSLLRWRPRDEEDDEDDEEEEERSSRRSREDGRSLLRRLRSQRVPRPRGRPVPSRRHGGRTPPRVGRRRARRDDDL